MVRGDKLVNSTSCRMVRAGERYKLGNGTGMNDNVTIYHT